MSKKTQLSIRVDSRLVKVMDKKGIENRSAFFSAAGMMMIDAGMFAREIIEWSKKFFTKEEK